MKAIISDIHSNLEALQAVLADIAKHNVTEIYCLGDIIGYGPNPRECIDLVMQVQARPARQSRSGRHVRSRRLQSAGRACHLLDALAARIVRPRTASRREKRWEFLAERPRTHNENGLLFVHGSARNPLNEYVFPEDIYNQRKMDRIFALVEKYCFQGHTHVPGVFTESLQDDSYQFHRPKRLNDFTHKLDARKTMVNVGSVGQPRDGDWRACYVLLDGENVRFRRVEYDIDTTIQKIHDIPDLDNFLGDRLRDGR